MSAETDRADVPSLGFDMGASLQRVAAAFVTGTEEPQSVIERTPGRRPALPVILGTPRSVYCNPSGVLLLH